MTEPIKTIVTVVGILVYFASGVMLGIVADAMAKGKGYKGRPHLITCILFNIFGFIGACALPDRKNNERILAQLKAIAVVFGAEEVEDVPAKKVVREEEAEEPAYREVKREPAPVEVRPAPRTVNPYAESAQASYFSSRMSAPVESKPSFTVDENATAQVVYKDGSVCCSRCGNGIKLNAVTCPHCRAKIVSSSSSAGLGYIKPLN